MPLGKYLLAPLLVFNLAGEMMYILSQRLKAQNISVEKGNYAAYEAAKVLSDIGGAIFKQEFVQQLMRSQRPLTITFLRHSRVLTELFHQLVHTSIMKLNEVSMGKLFDLMIMCFKAQIFLTCSATELYAVTMNHLKEVGRLLQKGPAYKNIESCIVVFRQKYEGLSAARYLEIKQELLNLMQSYKIRISILLQEGLQNEDGTLIYQQRYAGHASKPIGHIEYLIKGISTKQKLGPYDKELTPMNSKDFREWKTELGLNMYEGMLPKRVIGAGQQAQKKWKSTSSVVSSSKIVGSIVPSTIIQKNDKTLSTLLLGSRQDNQGTDVFQLDVFSDSKSKQSGTIDTAVLQHRPKTQNSILQQIKKQFEEIKEPEVEEEDDLLDLLDKATKK